MRTIKHFLKLTGPILLATIGSLLFLQTEQSPADSSEVYSNSQEQIELADTETTSTFLIDVPLENQNSGEVPLENGCEITALSMLLSFYNYDTNKNDLAEMLDYVPVYEDEANELRGNPHEGFVGNIYGGLDAMGVAVEPIETVAKEIVQKQHTVVASNETALDQLEQIIEAGTPVWVITTVDFAVPSAADLQTWQTTSGEVTVSPLCHAVVITGVNQDYVYVNDPYGYKNRVVDRGQFETIFERMGSQSLYLSEA